MKKSNRADEKRSTKGSTFKVTPLEIDQTLFKKKRKDPQQEELRQLILEAFRQMKRDSKYARPFKIMIPEKTWKSKSVPELEELANKLGDHLTDWVEQAFEWAQKISNGESWESICNELDTAKWVRCVKWKAWIKFVGGSSELPLKRPAFFIRNLSSKVTYENCDYAVPSVVIYD